MECARPAASSTTSTTSTASRKRAWATRNLDLADAVRLMRRIADKTQAEYAKLVGVSPRVLIDFERGVGNPTVRTLRRMLEPFGLDLTGRLRARDGGVGTSVKSRS